MTEVWYDEKGRARLVLDSNTTLAHARFGGYITSVARDPIPGPKVVPMRPRRQSPQREPDPS